MHSSRLSAALSDERTHVMSVGHTHTHVMSARHTCHMHTAPGRCKGRPRQELGIGYSDTAMPLCKTIIHFDVPPSLFSTEHIEK